VLASLFNEVHALFLTASVDELREPLLATLPDDAFAFLSRRSFAAPSAIAQQQYLLVMAQLAHVGNGCRGASATSAGSIAALGCPSPDVLQLLDALLLSMYVLNQMVPPDCFDPHDHIRLPSQRR
jgi:hypothetical protein